MSCVPLLLTGCAAMHERSTDATATVPGRPVVVYFSSAGTAPVSVHGYFQQRVGGQHVSCGGTLHEPLHLRPGAVEIEHTCPAGDSYRGTESTLTFPRAGAYFLYCTPGGELLSAPIAAPADRSPARGGG